MSDDLEPYVTSNTPLAAYLHMKGMVFLHVMPEKDNPRRLQIVFMDEPERPRYVQEWLDDDGGFYSYHRARKIIDRLIMEEAVRRGIIKPR